MEHEGGLQPISALRMAQLDEAVSHWQGNVWDVMPYLMGRGLTMGTVDGFRLGVVTDPDPEYLAYEGMLCIPYLSKDGLPLTVRFRCAKDHSCKEHGHPKYRSLPGDPARLFNIAALHRAGETIGLCEGELETMILRQCGYEAVAVPGATAWKAHYPQVFAGYSKVLVCADGDEAGGKMIATVRKALWNAEVINIPNGEDVNSTFLKYGKEGIDTIMSGGRI